jgi:hypothetical protein
LRWGGDGEKKGVKVGTNHIQQSTKAGDGAGRQWGGGTDGGQWRPMTTADMSRRPLTKSSASDDKEIEAQQSSEESHTLVS